MSLGTFGDSDADVSPLLSLPNTYRAFYGAFAGLRPIQIRTIAPILEGRDLLCQSATGSGKTEAVLAPVLERVLRGGRQSSAIYVVPTRALALDLERRLTPLFQRLELRLAIRTGDLKRAGGSAPDLLLTTPESLDVALGSSNADLRRFLERVRMVVIDEIHPLFQDYRGRQLAFLLHRLELRCGTIQRLGLSATVAQPQEVLRFFGFRPDAVCLVEPLQREILPSFVHLRDDAELVDLLQDLYQHFGHRKILLFANSRGRCDGLFGWLNQQGPFQGKTDLHYSNLRPRERRLVEARFRRRAEALCIATSTLELGIDIGDVDAVLLYEPPESVSAFLQRLGRSNRRESVTRFWGICRGGRAGQQLVRFLALLNLARGGIVEAPPKRRLPSVLVQQTLSCLYERKRISLPALQALFPDAASALKRIVPRLLRNQWLRSTRPQPLLRGGWRYREVLLERKLWTNLPDTGEPFALEVNQETIADLPPALVRQLEAGARVQLAGRRLRVLSVESGERRVVAQPITDREVQDVLWFGPGGRISFEVAEAMGRLLIGREAQSQDGLFRRTRRLLDEATEQMRQSVTLANGIRAYRTDAGWYRYCTFLGSAANLILRWAIAERFPDEDLHLGADEIALDCSRSIDFQSLVLPRERSALTVWVSKHLRALRAVLPLNFYASALPQALLAEEVADFLYDPRVLQAFDRLASRSSAVVAGDPRWLDDIPIRRLLPESWLAQGEPLLDWERRRWLQRPVPLVPSGGVAEKPRTRWTATMVGEFFRHGQCQRWLSRELSGYPIPILPESGISERRKEQGRQQELWVLESLRQQGALLLEIDETGLPADRAAQTRDCLEQALAQDREAWLVHPVLRLRGQPEWMGIPDLIRVDRGRLEVIDVKDTDRLRYGHQWQVAFYAVLLQKLDWPGVSVSGQGGLWLRQGLQSFDLQPFLTAFPALEEQISRVGRLQDAEATWAIGTPCIGCPHFEACYREHLTTLEFTEPHRIALRKKMTRRVPTTRGSVVFVHAQVDPVTGQLQAAGFQTASGNRTWNLQQGSAMLAALESDLELAVGLDGLVFSFGELRGWTRTLPPVDLRRLLLEHFQLPIPGRLTLWAAARLLGLQPGLSAPESLWHPEAPGPLEDILQVGQAVLEWCLARLQGDAHPADPKDAELLPEGVKLLRFLEDERRLRQEDLKSLMSLTLEERVARFRAIGPLQLRESLLDEEGRFLHLFTGPPGLSRFREDDFLRLLPAGLAEAEDGLPVALIRHDRLSGEVLIRPRGGRIAPVPLQKYSLEEEPLDPNLPKLFHVVRESFASQGPAVRLLRGQLGFRRPIEELRWVRSWRARMGPKLGLNPVQEAALELPFRQDLALVQGPPGTGKTHLLAWTVIALLEYALEAGKELRVAVTALTHRAIDELLERIARLAAIHGSTVFPCFKWGRPGRPGKGVEKLGSLEDLLQTRHAVLGATGFGLYDLAGARQGRFPRIFGQVVFDEASQLLVPQALFGLAFGQERFLFAGDDRQLGPVVLGKPEDATVGRSVLSTLLEAAGPQHRVRLELSYRMSQSLCEFPSQTWYDGTLRAAPQNADARLELPGPRSGDLVDKLLEPDLPTVLLLVEDPVSEPASDTVHSGPEVQWMAELARRLLVEQGFAAGDLALISPHRARNNAILARLAEILGPQAQLPLVDTLERMQGSERTVVIVGLVGAEAEDSEFLNDPRRFDVSITRARQKLIVVGGTSLFRGIPGGVEMLERNRCFKAFLQFCRQRGALFEAGSAAAPG